MERIITETAKDPHPTILAIRGYNLTTDDETRRFGEPFGPCSREDAVRQLDGHKHRYFVVGPSASRPLIPVYVVHGATCNYLRTRADGTPADNLTALPDFPWPLPEPWPPPTRPA